MYSPGANYGSGRPDQWARSRSPDDTKRYAPPGPAYDPPPFRDRGPGQLFPAAERDSRRDPYEEEQPRKRLAVLPPNPTPQTVLGGPRPGTGPISKPPPEINDCEIIVLGNPDPNYVSMVEDKIKAFSLKVDVMLPKPGAKISTFIENLAHRGTTFAVVIREDNQVHKSVSVHVLRGPPKPEEHRNMPLQTAFSLIQKYYADLKKKEVGVIPENIKSLMRYMLEDRSLTDGEYGMMIAFLQERRRRQAAFDSRTPYEPPIYNPEELQKRILNIFTGDPKAY